MDIASFLPRHDLRNLLLVPHVLSSIASQLLFRNVCLQFGTAQLESGFTEAAGDVDKWHAQRSADILARLISDVAYAGLVRSLTIWAPEKTKNVLTSFQTGVHVFRICLLGIERRASDAGDCPSEAYKLESLPLPDEWRSSRYASWNIGNQPSQFTRCRYRVCPLFMALCLPIP
jgi:hypothetical protein